MQTSRCSYTAVHFEETDGPEAIILVIVILSVERAVDSLAAHGKEEQRRVY